MAAQPYCDSLRRCEVMAVDRDLGSAEITASIVKQAGGACAVQET
jgi:hypothetical protein